MKKAKRYIRYLFKINSHRAFSLNRDYIHLSSIDGSRYFKLSKEYGKLSVEEFGPLEEITLNLSSFYVD